MPSSETNKKPYFKVKRTSAKSLERNEHQHDADDVISSKAHFYSPSTTLPLSTKFSYNRESLMKLCSFEHHHHHNPRESPTPSNTDDESISIGDIDTARSTTTRTTNTGNTVSTQKFEWASLSVPNLLQQQGQQQHEEESPTSILDMYMMSTTPLQEHMNKLLDLSSGDISMGKLVPVLVDDNARTLPLSHQSTPITPRLHHRRPVLSASVSDQSITNHNLHQHSSNKYRPCRWTSAASPEQPLQPTSSQQLHGGSDNNSSIRKPNRTSSPLPPPPFAMSSSPDQGREGRKAVVRKDEEEQVDQQQQQHASTAKSPFTTSSASTKHPRRRGKTPLDKKSVSSSSLDVSQHRELPLIRSKQHHHQHHPMMLHRRSSDSVLVRPERRDSYSSDFDTISSVDENLLSMLACLDTANSFNDDDDNNNSNSNNNNNTMDRSETGLGESERMN